jgi:hypothetical protein
MRSAQVAGMNRKRHGWLSVTLSGVILAVVMALSGSTLAVAASDYRLDIYRMGY